MLPGPERNAAIPLHDEAEKQDLSAADEQELRAFIEKRKWFEAKLEFLQALAPIYPFIHPVLMSALYGSASSFAHLGEAESAWKLPDTQMVEAWVVERDAVEEEVERFDGGDMERMKAKTRQVTRVPLTQPSTDLVEITLDLILLIDRLLKVLRQRGAVLDLVALRLQWDELRWAITQETERVRGEIDEIVRGRGRWAPPDAEDGLAPSASTADVSLNQKLPVRRTSSSFQTPVKRPIALPGSASLSPTPNAPSSPTHSVPSPTRTHFTPKRNLHLPILHSQVVSLQVRQRTLTASSLAISGTVIDKMIDSASQLKGLGGVHGPAEDEGKEGAVPEELIDMQEELEEQVDEVGARLGWCKQLEEQWKRADAHHAAASKARETAETFLESLRVALASLPSIDDHAHLEHLLRLATTSLPPVIDETFPRPSHLAYPDNDGHNLEVVAILTDARTAACQAIEVAHSGMVFYSDLLAARNKVLRHLAQICERQRGIDDVAGRIRTGTADAPRPLLQVQQVKDSFAGWHAQLPAWTTEAQTAAHEAGDVCQQANIDVMRYRKSMRAPPAVRPYLPEAGIDDPTIPETQAAADVLIDAANRLKVETAGAKEDAEVHSQAHRIDAASKQISRDAGDVRADLLIAIRESAWPSTTLRKVDIARIERLGEACKDAAKTFKELDVLLAQQGKSLPDLRTHLQQLVNAAGAQVTELHRLHSVARRVGEQSAVTRAIDEEGERYVERAQQLVSAVGMVLAVAPEVQSQADALQHEIDAWTSHLSVRAVFVDTVTSPEQSTTATSALVTPTLQRFAVQQVEPITPPISPGIPLSTDKLDLADLDRRVRAHINMRSSAVATAMAEVQRTLDEVATRAWAHELAQAIGVLDHAAHALEAERRDKAGRYEALNDGAIDDTRALQAIVLQLEKLQAELSSGDHLGHGVRQAVVSVVEVLNASTALRQQDRDAADRALGSANDALDAYGVLVSAVATALKDVTDRLARAQAAEQRATEDAAAALRRLRDRLDALNLPLVVEPSSDDLRESPSLRRLPSADLAERVHNELDHIGRTLDDIPATADATATKLDLDAALTLAERLDQLVVFAASARMCDSAFSRLLTAIDDASSLSIEDVQVTVDALEMAFRAVRHDPRAIAERKRILGAWQELRTLVDDTLNPHLCVDAPSEAGSDVSAFTSVTAGTSRTGRMRRMTSNLSMASSSRSVSQPLSRTYDTSTAASRARAVSDTPGPSGTTKPGPLSALASASASRIPRPIKSAVSQTDAGRRTPRTSLGPGPRPSSRASIASTARSRQPSMPGQRGAAPRQSFDTPRQRKVKAYVADPNSKLDIAVGRIVNKLDADVPVVPVGLGSPDGWKDESGKYWIGAEGRARLCFCRILRSRTVMVRVGGGWVELSRFLLDHFADVVGDAWQTPTPFEPAHAHAQAAVTPPEPGPVTPSRFGYRATPAPLTSTLLRQRQASHPGPRTSTTPTPKPAPAPALAPTRTAARTSLPLPAAASTVTPPRTPRDSLSTHPRPHSASPSPAAAARHSPATAAATAAGGASPLVPLHFIRRASESPSVRDKERDALRASRRGTLGKSTSGSVLALGGVREGEAGGKGGGGL
ncbi:hypothetical protein Q5752_003702 [Cryptotrichosporon argae]